MSKTPKRKPPIDFNRLTDGQTIQIQRIATTGARIGLAQQKLHEGILDAIRNSFDPMLEANEGEKVVAVVFSALGAAASAANARRIAQHPLCPQHVADEIAARLDAQQGAAAVEKKTADAPKPDRSTDQQQ